MKRRILSTLMLIVFVVVSFAVPATAAVFTDIENDSSTLEAVTVLNKLGVINGYEDNTFRPTNNVTRAEFTAMLLRTRNLGSVGSTSLENPPFPDVTDPSVSWAIGNIRTARDMKIINGYDDGTFKPNNTVTYEEAIKMIVCALGYGDMGVAAEGTAWYAKYLTTATQLKFLDGAGGQIGVPATRATIAKMLYNCLEVKIAENNEITQKTILEADLGLIKDTGFIASNPEISLSAPDANLRADEVQIISDETGDTITCKVDNVEEYADMLGAQITFYYKDDRSSDTKTLVMANVERSVTVEVAADQIDVDECNSSSVSYYASEDAKRITTLNMDSDCIVVYNGQLYGADTEESYYSVYYDEMDENAIPLVGTMKFLDKDADKKYDIVFVDSYDAYIVSSVTTSTKTIVDNNLRKNLKDGQNKITLDPDDTSKTVKIVDKNGKEVAFNTIKTGSVVCVKSSNPLNGGEQIVTAVVCNDTVSGTVKGVNSDDSIKIDSKSYKFSALAPWVNPIEGAETVMTKPEMGDSGKFYLDMNGNIIGYDKTEQTTNQQYGYLMSVKEDNDGFDDILVLRILTQTGSKTSYYAYEKTKVNGDDFSSYDRLLEALEETANPSGRGSYPNGTIFGDEEEDEEEDEEAYAVSQLIKFTTKSNKGQVVIDEIITVTDDTKVSKGGDASADELFFFDAMNAGDSVKYKSSGKQLTGDKNITINSSIIFRIPEDRADVDSYKKMSLNDFDHNETYSAEFYDVSTANTAKVVLVYGGGAEPGEVKATSPVMVITEIENPEDPSGEQQTRYKLKGYVGSTEVEYWGSHESEDVFETLQPGDVVRLGTDGEDYYTVKEEHIIFSVADGFRDTAIEYEPNEGEYEKELKVDGSVRYRVIWGSAYQFEKDNVFVMSKNVLEGDEDENDVDNSRYDMQLSWFKNAKIYEFNAKGKTLDIIEHDKAKNEAVLEGLQYYDGSSTPDEVFVHMTGASNVATVIIVRR